MNYKNCGACGEFYALSESDKEGFHSVNFCTVRADEELPRLINSVAVTIDSLNLAEGEEQIKADLIKVLEILKGLN